MADEPKKTLPQIKQEVDDLTQRVKSPQGSTIEEREKSRTDSIAQALSLSAQMQSMLSKAEYSQLTGTIALGQAGLAAAAEKLTQAAGSIPGASVAGSQVGQMLQGYRQRQEARRQGGVGGPDQGSGGGVGAGTGGAGGQATAGSIGGGGGFSGYTGDYTEKGGSYTKVQLPGGSGPASIRANNPGAMWDGPSATKFGSNQYAVIGGGNHIAIFPSPIHGAAAQFDLLGSPKYSGMTIGAAINKWSGHNSSAAYGQRVASAIGLSPNDRLTRDILESPKGLKLAQAMAGWEAGRGYSRLNNEGWKQAQDWAFKGIRPKGIQPPSGPPSGSPGTSLAPQQRPKDGRFEGASVGREAAAKAGIKGVAFNQASRLGIPPGVKDQTTITTNSGAKFSVSSKLAPQWRGFLNDLEATGYHIDPKQSGGYNYRNVAGTSHLSQHAYANAIDINWNDNPFSKSGRNTLPANAGQLANKWGLVWGGYMSGKHDTMHFEGARVLSEDEIKRNYAGQSIRPQEGPKGEEAVKRAHKEEKTMMGGLEKREQELKEGERKQWPGEKEYKGPQKGLDRATAERISTEQAFGKAETSTIKTQIGRGEGSGSAFQIAPGYYMTAAHYLGRSKSLTLIRDDQRIHAEIIQQNKPFDYAILKTSPQDAEKLTQSGMTSIKLSSEIPKEGTRMTTQGFSGQTGEYSTSSGTFIKAEDTPIGFDQTTTLTKNVFQINPEEQERVFGRKMPGTSGGPVTAEGIEGAVGLVSGGGGGPQGQKPLLLSAPMHQIIEDIPENLRQNIPQLQERILHEKMKEQMTAAAKPPAEGPGVSGPYGGQQPQPAPQEAAPEQRKPWPGELPSAPIEARKDQQTQAAPPERKPWPGEREYKGPQKRLEEPAKGADGKPARGQPSQKQADGSPSPHAEKAREQARGGRIHIPGKSLSNVSPELRGRLESMYQAAPASAKAGFYVISGKRSTELQAKLYQRYKSGKGGIAAPPGHSKHEIGQAVDIRDPSGWFHQHAREYGLQFPMEKGDWPHMQMDPGWRGRSEARPEERAKPEESHEVDIRPHEIKKGALRERARERPGHHAPQPQHPHKIKHPTHQEHHHLHQARPGPHWATTHHAKPSASTQTRVQHSIRTKRAIDDNFQRSSSPNADYA